jgi:hypothetical protein
MAESYKVLCNDFYVNQKLQVKMELPRTRETVLDLFERARRQYPHMAAFRRFKDEFVLESPQTEFPHRWLSVRGLSIRTGTVNPTTMGEAYSLHTFILENAPPFLSISALDIDSLEVMYGFDLAATGNHDAIVLDALIPGSPLAALLDVPNATPISCQPAVGLAFGENRETEVFFEVKTHPGEPRPREAASSADVISVFVTLRRQGVFGNVADLPKHFAKLTALGEELIENRVVPGMLVPLRDAIASGNAGQ